MNKKSIISASVTAILLSVSLFTAYASTVSILPTADGTYTAWTPKTGVTHYTMVDEATCNGTTDYVSTNTVGARDSYVTSLASIPNGSTITAIALTPCASRNSTGAATGILNVFYRLNGTNSADSGAYTPSGTTPTVLATTTFSGLSVVKTATSTLEVGQIYTSGTKGFRVSKMATVITYTPAPTFSIVASAGSNGSISPNGTSTVTQGNNLSYFISATSGYMIADVLVDGISVGATSSYTFTNVQAAHTISATFIPSSYNIIASAGANGTISPNGTTTVSTGTNKTFTITPNANYQISNVVVDGSPVGATSSYTFTNVQAAHTISATFTPITFTITSSYGPNGFISPSGINTVNAGSNNFYVIIATSTYHVADVLVDGASVGATTTYMFNNVQANHTISATFTQ
jgi:hypothetical protein